jgi:prevent-host-death family protein
MEKVINAVAARQNLGQMLEEAYYQGNSFIIERASRPMAAVIPIEQYRQWQMRREQFFALTEQVQERTRQVPVDELAEAITEAVSATKKAAPGAAR